MRANVVYIFDNPRIKMIAFLEILAKIIKDLLKVLTSRY